MSTTLAKPADVKRTWYILDAEGKSLGRVAAKAAHILRGKHKPTYTPNVDCGDHVIVINCDKIVLTGKKAEQKMHRYHTSYIGGLKEIPYGEMVEKKSDKLVFQSIKGMLPKNALGRKMFGKLHVYAGAEHPHAAQKPETLEFKF